MLVLVSLGCAPKASLPTPEAPPATFAFGWAAGDRAVVHSVAAVTMSGNGPEPTLVDQREDYALEVRADPARGAIIDRSWLGPVDPVTRAGDPYVISADGRYVGLADPELSYQEFAVAAHRATPADAERVVGFLDGANQADWQGLVGSFQGVVAAAGTTVTVERATQAGMLPMEIIGLPSQLTVGERVPCVAGGPPACVEVTLHTADAERALARVQAQFPAPSVRYELETTERLVVRPADLRPFSRWTEMIEIYEGTDPGTGAPLSARIEVRQGTCWAWDLAADDPAAETESCEPPPPVTPASGAPAGPPTPSPAGQPSEPSGAPSGPTGEPSR
jgi:hypothetical protein